MNSNNLEKECNITDIAETRMTIGQLEKHTYHLVFNVSGSEIFTDIIEKKQKYFWNYGDYTKKGSSTDFGCDPEPTKTDCVYADTATAIKNVLVTTNGTSTFNIHSKTTPEGIKKRESMRIQSVSSFVYGIFVFRVSSVPNENPETFWPAIWMTSPYDCRRTDANAFNIFGQWAYCGEIDILEGVCTKHSTSNVHVPCRNSADSINLSVDQSVSGPGYYVLQWTHKFLKLFFISFAEGDNIFKKNIELSPTTLEPFNKTSSSQSDPSTGTTSSPIDKTYWDGWKNTKGLQTLPYNGGKDVESEKDLGDKTWRRGGHPQHNDALPFVVPCQLPLNTQTNFSGDEIVNMLAQKKEAQFYSLADNAYKAGGLQIIMNIATAGSFCPVYKSDNKNVGTLGIDMVQVYQIQ